MSVNFASKSINTSGICVFICLLAYGISMATLPSDANHWQYYKFNGSGFVLGKPEAAKTVVALHESYWPKVTSTYVSGDVAKLPPVTGVIAGLCYIQTAGGKLDNRGASVNIVYGRMPVQIISRNGEEKSATTDDDGYFMVAVKPGRYSVVCGADSLDIVVENKKTKLIALRAGRRMVD